MAHTAQKTALRARRHHRIRARVVGTADRPRLVVYRSNTAVYAQLIDDVRGVTLAAADSRRTVGDTKCARAHAVGMLVAGFAKEKGIVRAVFDRGGFPFIGTIKEVANGAREGGLAF